MTEVNNIANSPLSALSSENRYKEEPKDNELGQSAFLELMIAQLNNQDPLSPQENGEFIAQLAQFSSVEGIDKLNNNFQDFSSNFLSNQALQASSLVGRAVTVPSSTGSMDLSGVLSGVIDVPSSSGSVQMEIFDDSGQLVDRIDLGQQPGGELVFRWNGAQMEVNGELMESYSPMGGETLPPGEYTIQATAEQGDSDVALSTALSANVNSVTMGAGGSLILNLAGIGPVGIEDVKQFN